MLNWSDLRRLGPYRAKLSKRLIQAETPKKKKKKKIVQNALFELNNKPSCILTSFKLQLSLIRLSVPCALLSASLCCVL